MLRSTPTSFFSNSGLLGLKPAVRRPGARHCDYTRVTEGRRRNPFVSVPRSLALPPRRNTPPATPASRLMKHFESNHK